MNPRLLRTVLVVSVVPWSIAWAQEREDVVFELIQAMPAPSWHVFVLGDLPELGDGDILGAVKLQSADRVDWSVTISLPVNRSFTYRFYRRQIGGAVIGDASNAVALGPPRSGQTSHVPLTPRGKWLHYHSDLDTPHLYWRQDEADAFDELVMVPIAPGRTPDETRWLAPDFGEARRAVEFYLTDSQGAFRDPVVGTYALSADELFLQDGAIYTYVPAPSPSPHRRDYSPSGPPTIQSAILGQAREYRVMLPRGYDEHTDRSYPVLYMYDGDFLWDGGASGYDPDAAILAGLVRRGHAGELIAVGIDPFGTPWTCSFNSSRARDCLSPEDTVDVGCGPVTGQADLFGAFVRDELKPWIDANYRTRPEKETTFAQGYSFGGVFALYLAWELTETFGGVASQSGSFWVPNFTARVKQEPKRDARIYVDTGTARSNYSHVRLLRDNLVGKAPPYVEEGDLRYRLGYDHDHTYESGGRRIPEMMEFLYPATHESPLLFTGDAYCESTRNSSGRAASLRATGTTRVVSNDLVLHAVNGAADQSGVFLYGSGQAQIPLGDGFLCISPFAPGIHRLQPTQTTDSLGFASHALDLNTVPAIGAGSTWNFQFLFRDGMARGAGFNTTDGLSVTFMP